MRLIALVALVMIAFAANSVLNRLALEPGTTGPTSFALIRLVSGAMLLALLVAVQGQVGLLRPRRAMLPGVLTLSLYVIGFSLAYQTLDAGIGALILFGGVQITMFAGAAVSGQSPSLRRIAGALIAFAGLTLLLATGPLRPDPTGAALMIAAALGWGLFSLLGRRAGPPLPVMANSFLWSIPLGVLAFVVWPDTTDMHGAWLAVASGALTSGLGYALWYRVLPLIQPTTAAIVQLTVPLIAMAGGMVFLTEPLTTRFVLSAALVLGGIALSLRRPDRD